MVYQSVGSKSFTAHRLGRATVSESNPNSIKYGVNTGPPVDQKSQHCDTTHHVGGPFWLDPIHSKPFVQRMLAHARSTTTYGTHARMMGMLTVISEVRCYLR